MLAAPRLPVTRWNRRYLLAGAGALAAIVAAGFYIGFGGANTAGHQAPPAQPAADVTPATPAIADRYAKGYADPAVAATALPGAASSAAARRRASGRRRRARRASATGRPRRAAGARSGAGRARSANPFFAAAPTGEDAGPPAAPVSA